MGPSPAPGAPLRQAKTLRTFSGQEQPGGSLRGREGGLIYRVERAAAAGASGPRKSGR